MGFQTYHGRDVFLSGSSIGLIERTALAGDAPLFGRKTYFLEVAPLKFVHLREWFSHYTPHDLVKIYVAFGRTPAYLEMMYARKSPEENIMELILRKGASLYDAPESLLREELREPSSYMRILTAISLGKKDSERDGGLCLDQEGERNDIHQHSGENKGD